MGTAPGFVVVHSPVCLGYRVHAGGISQITDVRAYGVGRLIDEERAGRYPGGAEPCNHEMFGRRLAA